MIEKFNMNFLITYCEKPGMFINVRATAPSMIITLKINNIL